MDKRLWIAIEAARKAGEYQRRSFGDVDEYEYKRPGDPISVVDKRSEELIVKTITDAFPDHAIHSEESGMVGSGDPTWVVDPLDGTSNYLRGLPYFSVSIALESDGRVELGVIYRPMSDELFAASDGASVEDTASRHSNVDVPPAGTQPTATDDNSHEAAGPDDAPSSQAATVPISVSDTNSIKSALIAIPYSSSNKSHEQIWDTHRALGSTIEGIRSTGSGALDLALVAAGRVDAAVGFNQQWWDCAAGLYLIEAGRGTVTGHSGEEPADGTFLASNETLHEDVLARLKHSAPTRS